MANLDLVQLRWQQIRSVEAHQLILKENIELKNEITKLKERLADSSGVKMDLVKKIQTNWQMYSLKAKNDLMKLKAQWTEDLNSQTKKLELLTASNQKFVKLLKEKTQEIKSSKAEMKKLQNRIEDLESEITDRGSIHKKEIDVLETRYANVKNDFFKLKSEINNLDTQNQTLKDEKKDILKEKNTLEKLLQESKSDQTNLRQEINSLNEELKLSIMKYQEGQKSMSEKYEKMIEEMGLENQCLRNHIFELEGQIQRLSNALVGNKSHFAKYVEVKSENLALQAKLDIVLKKVPNIKEKLLTSKDSESRQAPLVLPKLKSQQKRKSLDFFDEKLISSKLESQGITDKEIEI